MYGINDFVIPGEDPGSILLRCPLQTAVGRNGSRIESGKTSKSEFGMTVKSVYGMTVKSVYGMTVKSVYGMTVKSVYRMTVKSVYRMTVKSQTGTTVFLSSRAKTRDPSCCAALCKRR
jgi:ribosomal protein L23